ncbi:MAG: hypothetical protein O2955_07925 [Planctomycetota bacterium]|nr:hypothetical protein [Planctomycetota bacterium]MDA1212429.1 hypothetical protein [Planctomycetota bacterium]
MSNDFAVDSIPYRRWFPWLGISRAIFIALDPRNILTAFLGIILMYTGHFVLSLCIPSEVVAESARISMPQLNDQENRSQSIFDFINEPDQSRLRVTNPMHILWRPYRQILYPAARLFFPNGGLSGRSTWTDIVAAWSILFWDLIIWSICGGAITRQAGSQFARHMSLSIGEAIRFSRAFYLAFFSAPLLPFVGIGTLFVTVRLFGLFALIPGDGDFVMGIFWFIPLILSLLMAIIMFCIAICWPLMFAAISVEGSDAFDGLSRSYGYLTGRPWQMAWYIFVAFICGAVMIAFVQLLLTLTIYLSIWCGVWIGDDTMRETLQQQIPVVFGGSGATQLTEWPTSGLQVIGYWMEGFSWLFLAIVYSYFWCATTIIYFLLRRSNDGTDLSTFYLLPPSPDLQQSITSSPLQSLPNAVANSDANTEEPTTSGT